MRRAQRPPSIRLWLALLAAPGLAAADTLPDPAAAPPAPALLGPRSAPAPASGRAPLALPPVGVDTLPGGGWRIAGRGLLASLAALGRALAEALPEGRGRITLVAEVAAPADDPSSARRESLARALAVRGALESGGLPVTRIDIRPLGRTEAARDVVDILPPGATR
jgi:hypothetical protein